MNAPLDDALRDEIRVLAMQLVDRALEPDRAARLFELLRNSAAVRQFYLEEMNLAGSIYWDSASELRAALNHELADRFGAPPGGSAGDAWCGPAPAAAPSVGAPAAIDSAASLAGPPTRRANTSAGLSFLGAAVQYSLSALSSPKAVVIGVTSGLLTYFLVLVVSIAISRAPWGAHGAGRDPQPPPQAATPQSAALPPEGTVVGSLTADTAARWSKDKTAPESRNLRSGADFALEQGRVRMRLARGATVVIEGPAVWRIESEQRLSLESGTLSAHVPQTAIGFTVITPAAEFVDLGTDFSLVVDQQRETQLAVNQGAVQLVPRDAAAPAGWKPIQIKAGEAISVRRQPDGALSTRPITLDTYWRNTFQRLERPLEEPEPVAAFQASPPGSAGNVVNSHGNIGFDFRVARPIRVFSLGIFDHLGDGIDPASDMTVQLWSRDDHGTLDTADDTGVAVLAQAVISSRSPTRLIKCHRFMELDQPLDLEPGEYSLLAWGFSSENRGVEFHHGDLPPELRAEFDTSRYAIVPIECRAQLGVSPGNFPRSFKVGYQSLIGGSFQYTERP